MMKRYINYVTLFHRTINPTHPLPINIEIMQNISYQTTQPLSHPSALRNLHTNPKIFNNGLHNAM